VEARLENMGRFQLARAQELAATHGIEAEAMVRRGRLRRELIAAAREVGATLIVLGRPHGQAAVFEEETLRVFAAGIEAETGVEVRIV
jgi:nucleotide-binding universal stress UspA family protein